MATASTVMHKVMGRNGPVAHIRELLLIAGAYLVYMIIRKAVAPVDSVAITNAVKLVDFENAWGFFWELTWQDWTISVGEWLVILFNWIYIFTFFPIVLTTALIYYIRDRDKYFYYRSVILLSFAVALIVFVIFPLAPPRMMSEHGFVDTIKSFGPAWYGSREMASYYNAYAAMPSLHFAWTVVFGVLFFRQGRLVFKFLGVLYPATTLFAITMTGNHYILDAVMGAVTMLAAYLIYEVFFNRGRIVRFSVSRIRPHFYLPIPQWRRGGNGRIGSPS